MDYATYVDIDRNFVSQIVIDVLTINEVAKTLKIAEATVFNLVVSKEIKPIKVTSKEFLFFKYDIEQYAINKGL